MTIVIAAIFAIICFSVAVTGYTSLGEITDATQSADARGYALFWAFLGTICVVLGAVSWWILRTGEQPESD